MRVIVSTSQQKTRISVSSGGQLALALRLDPQLEEPLVRHFDAMTGIAVRSHI